MYNSMGFVSTNVLITDNMFALNLSMLMMFYSCWLKDDDGVLVLGCYFAVQLMGIRCDALGGTGEGAGT